LFDLDPTGSRAKKIDVRGFTASTPPEREFPALLVVWGYQQKQLIFGRGQFIFARKREKKILGVFFAFWGCFCAFWGCFCAFWGCFCAFWVFFCFSRASAIFLGELIYKGAPHQNGEFPLCRPDDTTPVV